MGSRSYTVYLRNDLTGDLKEMRVMAQSKKDAEDIAASRTGWEWIIDAIELN